MILWTFQPASILEEIERTGTFRCDPDRSFNLTKENSLKGQYAWLMDQMEKRIGPRPESLSEEDLRKETELSWQRVFDTEPYDSDFFTRGRYVQATFWEIRKEYIREIKYL
jgi:hypothetical protein